MVNLVNRAKMSTATTGTGTITLGSAVDGYQTFAAAGVTDGDTVRYVIEDGSNWEIGTGTYTASGTTLSRTPSESSNADAAINLSGAASVFIGAAAADILQPGDNISELTNDAGYTTNIGDITGVTAGSGLSGGGSSGSVTLSHADTSSQGSVNNSGRTFIQDITLDTYGHVTGIVSATDSDTFTGTVTSVGATAGTGISITGSPITTSGTLTITNTAPDQTVVLTSGTGISATGTYPNFTITNTAPDQTVVLTEGSNVTITGTYPNFTIASSDQFTGTVTSVGGTGTVNGLSLSGTVTSTGDLTLGGTLAISDADWSGTDLSVANGGTGASSFTANNVLLGNGTSSFQTVAPGTSGNVLTSNGTTWTSAAPAGGGAWELISTTNTGTASSVTLTIPTGYKQLKFLCEELRFSSTATLFIDIANSSNTRLDSWWVYRSIRASGSSETTYSSLGGSDTTVFESANSGTDQRVGLYINIDFQFIGGAKYVGYWQGGGRNSSGFYLYTQGAFGSSNDSNTAARIRFKPSANFLSGKIHIFGLS